MTLHGVSSKSLKLGRKNLSKEPDKYKQYRKIQIKVEMIASEVIQAVVNQAARAAVMALREADAGPGSGASSARQRAVHRQRHCGLALKQPSFSWKTKTSM